MFSRLLICFLILCLQVWPLQASSPTRAIDALLKNSIFRSENTSFRSFPHYDPVSVSIAASLKSQQPSLNKEEWEELAYFTNEDWNFYQSAPTLYWKTQKSKTRRLFILLPGSFATWRRGSFTSLAYEHLNKAFPNSDFLAMPGLYTPELLEGRCSTVPWDMSAMAQDIYKRILHLSYLKQYSEIGLVGFSGGASLALHLLSIDQNDLFNQGAMAFSPIIDSVGTFESLDRRHRQSKISQNLTLTGLDSENILGMIRNLGLPAWDDLLKRPLQESVRDRFFNEFIEVDLKDIVKACSPELSEENWQASYLRYFIGKGMGKELSVLEKKRIFTEKTDLDPILEKINKPVFIYASKDDPVLSNSQGLSELQSPKINQLIEKYQSHPQIQIFNPEKGGHVGVVLDPIYPDLLREFFK